MGRIKFIIIVSLLIYMGCDNSIEHAKSKTAGEITLNNDEYNSKIFGFSFSTADLIEYPNSESLTPDIILMAELDGNGNTKSIYLSSCMQTKQSFILMEQFSDLESAENYFYTLSEASEDGYEIYALQVKEYQVWSVKTVDDKYGKILILNTERDENILKPISTNSYGEVTFRWVYQPNGSKKFD